MARKSKIKIPKISSLKQFLNLFIFLSFHQKVTLLVPVIYYFFPQSHSPHTLPFLQGIKDNTSQTPLPNGFHVGLACGRH